MYVPFVWSLIVKDLIFHVLQDVALKVEMCGFFFVIADSRNHRVTYMHFQESR